MPLAFLALYVLFFSITGLNQIVQGTLHGKLVRAERRGRLMWLGGSIGSGLAIAVVPLLSALVSALATKGDLEADAGERTSCV